MTKYQKAVDASIPKGDGNISLYATKIMPDPVGTWEQRFLMGLWKNGLMLTTNVAYTLMGDNRYPGGIPLVAPRPTNDDPNCWPQDTWIIYRE